MPTPTPTTRGRSVLRLALLSMMFAFPLAGGWLNLLEVVRDDVDGVLGLDGVSGVALSPDGRLLVTSASLDDSVAVFRRDASVDSLEFAQLFDSAANVWGLGGASAVAASPDQRHFYATGETDDTLSVFRRDASMDSLAFVDGISQGFGGVFGLDGVSDVTVTPDDGHVLVTARLSNALTMFRRDGSLDDLAFVDVELDWVGLGGASAVEVDPGGGYVYVTGEEDDALALFSRQGDELELVESHVDGVDGVEGLAGASDVAVSPDGRFVYVTGAADDSVAVFERSGQGAGVSFLRAYRDNEDGIDGLDGASGIAMSPSGQLLFVAGRDEDAVAVFRRNGLGDLALLDVVRNGENGIEGLDGVVDLVVSGDALHVYTASPGEDAVASLRILTLLFTDGFESGNTTLWSSASP